MWSFSSQQATLRRLNKAFAGFFRRVKRGEKAGYPRFKGAARFDRWSGLKMGTVHVGCPSSGGCICRASARSSSICTAR